MNVGVLLAVLRSLDPDLPVVVDFDAATGDYEEATTVAYHKPSIRWPIGVIKIH